MGRKEKRAKIKERRKERGKLERLSGEIFVFLVEWQCETMT
jgi:hypothetical protein